MPSHYFLYFCIFERAIFQEFLIYCTTCGILIISFLLIFGSSEFRNFKSSADIEDEGEAGIISRAFILVGEFTT
jgi:hypothetical protein